MSFSSQYLMLFFVLVLSKILETPPNPEAQVLVFISPRNWVAQICPWALGSLSIASYNSQGYGGGILSRLHTGCKGCIPYCCTHSYQQHCSELIKLA
jgi:hypothetical protein